LSSPSAAMVCGSGLGPSLLGYDDLHHGKRPSETLADYTAAKFYDAGLHKLLLTRAIAASQKSDEALLAWRFPPGTSLCKFVPSEFAGKGATPHRAAKRASESH